MERVRRGIDELRHIREWRTSTKLMVLLMVVALGAIFLVSRQNEQRATQLLTGAQEKLLSNLADSVAVQVDIQVRQYRHDATQVATDPEVVSFMGSSRDAQNATGQDLLQRLAPVLQADPDYRLLLILDPNGKVVISNQPGLQGQDYSARDFFLLGKVAPAAEPYTSDIQLAEDHRSQIIYAASPIKDALGNLLGVVAIRVAPDKVVAPLRSGDLASEHRFGFLVSKDGVILANSVSPSFNYKVIGTPDSLQVERIKQQYQVDHVDSLGLEDLASLVDGATAGGFATAPLVGQGENDVIGWSPVSQQRWTALVGVNQAIFTSEVQDLSRTQLFNTLILALIIGGLVIFAGRMFETTERESLSDPLTGLANRRFFQEILLREMRRAQRSNQPISLILADIDYFKGVNDTYGHNVGDEVLEQVASIMLQNVRATDFVIRYGGEEFIVLLPETRLADARQVAEKLRKTVGDTILESTSRPGITLKVTISSGVAAYPADGPTGEAVILAADRALYAAKQRGRNRVLTVSELDGPEAEVASLPQRRSG